MEIPQPLYETARWDDLSSEERRALVSDFAASLPYPWQFLHLTAHSLGGVTHEIAFFDYQEVTFALIPGSSDATLGYDPSMPLIQIPELLDDIEETRKGWGDAVLELGLTPIRRVCIEPLLVEVQPTQATWVEERDDLDSLEAVDIAATYRRDGFRLPTSDEWEYLCAAGTRTLWRWGDSIPMVDSYHVRGWDEHRKPNAFGLLMNEDTYWTELCDDGILCAGDGGTSLCGSYGIVASWIPLTSSYRESNESFECSPTEYGEQMLVRRVWELAVSRIP